MSMASGKESGLANTDDAGAGRALSAARPATGSMVTPNAAMIGIHFIIAVPTGYRRPHRQPAGR